MGELVRRDDRVAVERAKKNVAAIANQSINEVVLEAFRASMRLNRTIVEETNAIESEQEYRLTAPIAQAAAELAARHNLALADENAEELRAVVREFRDRFR